MKNIAILGSTGSIGTQTLDVVRKNNDLRVVAVSAGRSVEKLEQQIREFHPLLAAVWDEKAAEDLKIRIADTTTKVVSGMDGLLELASMPESDILVTAIVGMIGIRPDHGRNPCRKRYRTCQQRNTCHSRSSDHAYGKRVRSFHPAC